jgi:uncharacterized protein (DUF2141 family)
VFVKEFPGLNFLIVLFFCCFTGACAVDRPPSGGPVGKTPLSVIASDPLPGSTNVNQKKIRLDFSHHVTVQSVRQALLFSPRVSDYSLSVHGKSAEIRLHTPLRRNRTYTIILNKSLTGFRGNRLERQFNLVFSTGPLIDSGSIGGQVYTPFLTPAADITLLAYAVDPAGTADPDPAHDDADYLTRTDESGRFLFENLAERPYRLIAINDRNGDLRFNPRNEEFAVLPAPAVEPGGSSLLFRLGMLETSPAGILSCEPVSDREIDVTLSRKIPSRAFDLSAFRIEDATAANKTLPLLACYSLKRAVMSADFRIVTAPMDPKTTYRLIALPEEKNGQLSGLLFRGSSRQRKMSPLSVLILPADRTTDAMLDIANPETGRSIELQFSHPVQESTLPQAVSLTAVRSRSEDPLPFSITKTDDRTFTVKAVPPAFQPGETYRLGLRPGLVTDVLNGRGRDTLLVSRFRVAGRERFGSISGSGKAAGRVAVLEARHAGSGASCRTLVTIQKDGAFSYTFRELPPGSYTVSGFVPETTAGTGTLRAWRGGSPYPFKPSEPFGVASDTVRVRAGWNSENILLDIPVMNRALPR